MGCWYETCGVSNLTIFAREEMLVIPIHESTYRTEYGQIDGHCGVAPFYNPVPLCYWAKYDDDHGGPDVLDEAWLNWLKPRLAQPFKHVDDTERHYHHVGNGELLIKTGYGSSNMPEHIGVYYFFVHATVARGILADPLCRHDWEYREPKMFEDELKRLQKLAVEFQNAGKKKRILMSELPFNVFDRGDRSLTGYGRYSAHIELTDAVDRAEQSNSMDEVNDLLKRHLTVYWISNFMDMTRKVWGRQGGAGSQECRSEQYIRLMQYMKDALSKRNKWNQEEGDSWDNFFHVAPGTMIRWGKQLAVVNADHVAIAIGTGLPLSIAADDQVSIVDTKHL